MPQTRAERLAQRAAERRARVEKQATRVDDVGATAAAREQQATSYKEELAQNRADRETRERAEADQLRASEAAVKSLSDGDYKAMCTELECTGAVAEIKAHFKPLRSKAKK